MLLMVTMKHAYLSGTPAATEFPTEGAWRRVAPMPWHHWPWWVCLIALSSQVFLGLGTTAAEAVFVAVMLSNAAAYPARSFRAITAMAVPWIYPAIALASPLWSDAPLVSMRLALELAVTTAAMIALSRQLRFRDMMSALMLALLLGAIASAVIAGSGSLRSAGRPVIGIFGSKNSLAFHMVLMVLASLGVGVDRGQPARLRLLAVFALALGLPLIVAARSAGATIMGAAAIVIFGAVIFLGALPQRARGRVLAAGLVVLVSATCLVAILGPDLGEGIMTATGKDATLTGRTYLWQRANDLIPRRPALGYGYQAFWRHDYVEAEGLWRFNHIDSRMGFHFHNLYYEALIELGMAGLAAMVIALVCLAWRSLRAAIGMPGASSAFLMAFCALLLMRSGIEVDLGFPSGLASVLFPMLLAYRPGTAS